MTATTATEARVKQLPLSSAKKLAAAVIETEAQRTTTGQCVLLARAVLAMSAVADAARAWHAAGGNPCGADGCDCTECGLWRAVDDLTARVPEGKP